jgi:hypothetical protein
LEVLLVLQPQEAHRLLAALVLQARRGRTLQTHTLLVRSEAEGELVGMELLAHLELPALVGWAELAEQLFAWWLKQL